MFQPTRPRLTWSSVRIDRARLYGWLNVVDAVRTSPRRSVARAHAVMRTTGSSERVGETAVIRKGGRVGQKQDVEQSAFTNSRHILIVGNIFVCLPLAARQTASSRMSRRRRLDGELHHAFGMCHEPLIRWDRPASAPAHGVEFRVGAHGGHVRHAVRQSEESGDRGDVPDVLLVEAMGLQHIEIGFATVVRAGGRP